MFMQLSRKNFEITKNSVETSVVLLQAAGSRELSTCSRSQLHRCAFFQLSLRRLKPSESQIELHVSPNVFCRLARTFQRQYSSFLPTLQIQMQIPKSQI